MKNKKLFGLAVAVLALSGCTYQVKPGDYHGKLVSNADGSELDIVNNTYGIVYDNLYDNGTLSSTTFDEIMLKIATEKVKEFYQGDNAFMTEAQFNAEVEKLINEKLYDVVSTSAYQKDNYFDEEVLVLSLEKQLYDIKKPTGASYNKNVVVFTPELKAEALEEGKLGGTDTYDASTILHYDYSDYKERKLKPQVLKELLYAKYLEDQSYANLGRAYARKVTYIAITKDSKYPDAAKNTIDAYVKEYITGNKTVDLNDLSKLWKGVDFSTADHELDSELSAIKSSYNLHTLADNIEEEYLKFMDYDPVSGTYTLKDKATRDSELYSEYTATHTRPAEKGKDIKDVELGLKSLVTDGWYIKNGGLTELPSGLRGRLFDPRTAQDFQALKDDSTAETNGYVRYINGNYYLVPALTESTSSDNDVVMYDRSTSTYYIVMIEDALNSNALSTKNLEGAAKNEVLLNAHEVAKMLGTKDANKTEAIIYYLENAGLMFYDQTIYDYFYNNYKDAFESDD